MTTIRLDDSTLHLAFPGWEALMVGRAGCTVDRDAITDVELLPGWSSEMLGARSGLAVSGHIKVGTFRHPSGTRRLVAMRRGLPLLRVRLAGGQEFDELLVSDTQAAQLFERLRNDARH